MANFIQRGRDLPIRACLALALAGAMLAGSACENNSGADLGTDLPPREDFYILPSAAELGLGAGNQAVFTVVGGQAPFEWAVERDALGTITATGDRSAVYERRPLIRGVNTVTVRDATVLKASASVIQ